MKKRIKKQCLILNKVRYIQFAVTQMIHLYMLVVQHNHYVKEWQNINMILLETLYVYTHRYTRTHTYIYMCVSHTYIYVYIYVYTYTHIYTYDRGGIHPHLPPPLLFCLNKGIPTLTIIKTPHVS